MKPPVCKGRIATVRAGEPMSLDLAWTRPFLVDLLRRWRAAGREDGDLLEALKATVKGIALGIQNTG